jgi:CRISPR-associated endonuclease/helicase Cas3
MIVTFISQCEKNALSKTRRVLDAFANRIGNRTWQTVITNEGLNAVKKLLRKTASKNTAVSCHWIRSRSRIDLVWIVGNRQKFNSQGIVPVNTTQKNILNTQWENDWHYLPLVKAIVALAALFHDWGKATLWFQNKLKIDSKKIFGDPLRHEWISCLIFCALIKELAEDGGDGCWLARLEEGEIDETGLQKALDKRLQEALKDYTKNVFSNLPDFANAVIWLVISHHRMPLPSKHDDWRGEAAKSIQQILKRITPEWGYENRFDEKEFKSNLHQCFEFPHGFPNRSSQWLKQIKRWAGKAKDCLPLLQKAMNEGSIRIVLFHARMCLMIGDHFYSSQQADPKWNNKTNLFANTDRLTKKLKQKLDEHLVEVAANALKTAHLLPAFENEPPFARDVHSLKIKSPTDFKWQDRAVEKINSWKKKFPEFCKNRQYGFFAVNMASTGCGKTFANAKIMRVLSYDSESLRYILALGLRTLTLQTGNEYRNRIGLDETELAVLIGSRAVMDLHLQNRKSVQEKEDESNELSGSESLESFMDEEIDYDCSIPEKGLSTVLKKDRDRKFLYAPVLACTIDHIMGATETKRGGRYILPALRLMSSDLVIDEVDDFDGKDLIAIGRLIHLAGMLGRRVMISSATIPPDLAEGYFNTYREGWMLFSKTRDIGAGIGCAWIDEFNTRVKTVIENDADQSRTAYKELHTYFVNKRIKKLKDQPVRRKAEIIECVELYTESQNEYDSIKQSYFEKIKQAIVEKHLKHNTKDTRSDRLISFGVVRMAKIEPCIELSEYLMKAEWPETFEPKITAYHSRQVLLLRNEQEKHLDEVLRRKEKDEEEPAAFKNQVIRHHIDDSSAYHIIFVLVATPVEEIGRDHDFDWAVIEPSSFRSLIQLAGRILRHRLSFPDWANVAVMQYNLRSLKSGSDKPAYCRPGYEDGDRFRLTTHDLKKLVDEKSIAQRIDAIPRIKRNEPLCENESLIGLEHHVIASLLTSYDNVGPQFMQGWLTQHWWLTAIPQQLNRFRESEPVIKLYLFYDDGELYFVEKDDKGMPNKVETLYGIKHDKLDGNSVNRLWLRRDYVTLLETIVEIKGDISMKAASLRYGEINFPDYENLRANYIYSDRFGLKKE